MAPKAIRAFAGLDYCGGGPFSSFWANFVSVPCEVSKIDACCYEHDRCYETPLSQTTCDNRFCECLTRIETNPYCEYFAQAGLCLATHVFGHHFHWSGTCALPDDDPFGNSTQRDGNCLLIEEGFNEDEYDHSYA
uniref:Phospholipase A2 n=1 Tax=Panagrellus redivivus TaxID=6233 RepID=A0A7E4UUP4_PANRE